MTLGFRRKKTRGAGGISLPKKALLFDRMGTLLRRAVHDIESRTLKSLIEIMGGLRFFFEKFGLEWTEGNTA
jgi:hypothetical protein